jgi:hypothetical protein
MPYTSNQLINGAYFSAGVVSREFETVSGSQVSDGLAWLNDILADKNVAQSMVPYETTYKFVAKPGVEKYYVPKLTQIDTLVFFLDQVRYSLTYTKRNEYFGSSRVENINTLPFQWYFERQTGGAVIYIYFKPDRHYPVEVHGSFELDPVSLNQDLSSNVSYADLGTYKIYSSVTLGAGQLVINNVDLQGVYENIGALVNYINSGIIPGVTSSVVNGEFILQSNTQPPTPIYVSSSGYPPSGTQTKGNVSCATVAPLVGVYANGNDGVGATITSSSPSAFILDGYTAAVGDRVLVKNELNDTQNGVYTVTNIGSGVINWVLTRAADYNKSLLIGSGDLVSVLNGTVNAGLTFVQNGIVSDIGVSSINFDSFNAITFSNFSTIQQSFYNVFNPIGFDNFYITYLRYALADRICAEYNYVTPENVVKQLSKYEGLIDKKSKVLDLRMQKLSTLNDRGSLSYAFINLGKGWRPS